NHLIVDRDDNVWATSIPKGIIQVKKKKLGFINYLPGMAVSRMTLFNVKSDVHLVVATQGAGMYTTVIDPKRLDSLTFRHLDHLTTNKGFKSLTGVSKGRQYLWASSLNAGILGVPSNSHQEIVEDGPVKLMQHAYDNSNTISSNVVISSMIEDEEGNLYAGTRADGLNKISPSVEYGKKGSVIRYLHKERDSTSIINNAVFDVKLQSDHSILVSTLGGLELLRDGKFIHMLKNVMVMRTLRASDGTLLVGTKSGVYEGKKIGDRYSFIKLPLRGDPHITAIAEDRRGRIWCLSYEGMYFYDRKTKLSLIFKKEDGLPSSRSLPAGDAAQTANGTMIVSSAEGLTFFDPLSLRINKLTPKPLLTQLKINNKIVSTSKGINKDEFVIPKSINSLSELTLDYTQNILTLEFSAMEFTAPTRNLYSYTLDGFDKGWVHTDWKNRSATYTNLRPGDYTFKVRATNSDGIANANETTLIIHVLPPPWKTWWAYSLYGVGVASLLFFARSNIIRHERLASKLELEHLELAKVQEIDKAKTNFFANISHEFRTPLTLIQGPVQNLLEKFKKDSETQNQLTLIQQNSDRLLRLVNQMLELARLESGSLQNEINEGDIVTFLKTVVESFSSLAVQKRIALIQQFPDHVVNAEFDMDKLEKITSNLISNALKFTPEHGAIIINVSLSTETKGKGNLLLRVTDTGKGVPPDQIDKIFERFYQVSEDGNLNVGSGIGLALCKELAEFLGGSLTLESKVGEGT
ncbi:MAG TPA: ATP-binding protein, partial [Chryseolinea sp.]|nr:ATP-binding protein [Chryseolinea sp.]